MYDKNQENVSKKPARKGSTGIRTQVARIRTLSDNQLHYGTELHIPEKLININHKSTKTRLNYKNQSCSNLNYSDVDYGIIPVSSISLYMSRYDG